MTRACADCGALVTRPKSPRCDPCRVVRDRETSRIRTARYEAQLPQVLTEEEHAALKRRRNSRKRRSYRKDHPFELCVDCGEEVTGRNDNKRCLPCRAKWRRSLASARQAAYRARKRQRTT